MGGRRTTAAIAGGCLLVGAVLGAAVERVRSDDAPDSSTAEERERPTPDAAGALPDATSPSSVPTAASSVPVSAVPDGGVPAVVAPSGVVSGSVFRDEFGGAPAVPTAWNPSDWDVTVHSRDSWESLAPMHAMHGPGCQGPPATHVVDSYDGAVFQCRDHVMTAIDSGDGYGVVYLTPAALVDFSAGEAVVRVDVSTMRSSGRDWWDIWVSPYADQVQLPLQEELPDLNGHPRTGVNVRMDFENERFVATVFDGGVATELPIVSDASYESVLTPDAARRDTFELRISRGRVRFGMPAYGLTWVDAPVSLGWSMGVVQFGHHSYVPDKAMTPANPVAGTWHWDNVEIAPAVPFTMVKADRRSVGGAGAEAVSFARPAPAGAQLRFAGIGQDMRVRFDGGAWQSAQVQWASNGSTENHFRSYWMPVPQGTTRVEFLADSWWGGSWLARDIAIWADNGLATPPPGAEP